MSLDFRYVPLSFIKTEGAIERQLINTIIFKNVITNYKVLRPLKQLIDKTQYGFTASAQKKGNSKLLRITDIKDGNVNWDRVPFCECDKQEKYLLSKGDVLIARTGNNISFLVDNNVSDNAVFASYLIRIICNKEKILPEYLYLFLNSYSFWSQILLKQRGALLQNVNAKRMGELLIPICPISTQKDIVSFQGFDEKTKEDIENVKFLFSKNKKASKNIDLQLDYVKQLRQAFLREAMRGELVPQNSNDKPANFLLEKIKAEKEQLIKEKKIRRPKPLPPIEEEEIPFKIPDNWVWCRLGEVARLITDGKHGNCRNQDNSGYYFLSAKDIKHRKFDYSNARQIVYSDFAETHRRTNLEYEDLCIVNTGATVGKTVIAPDDLKTRKTTFQKSVAVVKLFKKQISVKFIEFLIILNTPKLLKTSRGSAINNLLLGDMKKFTIPLPPLEEQKRIVAKLDVLMAYCDELEASIKKSAQENDMLLQQVLKEALQPKGSICKDHG